MAKNVVSKKLRRSMTPLQMEMIGIGGSIGVGLFMGSTSTIKWTGPSVVLAYLLVGMALFAVMRSHPFKLPLYPYSNYLSIGLLIVILFFMFINPDTQVSVSIGVVFLLRVSCMYWVRKKQGAV